VVYVDSDMFFRTAGATVPSIDELLGRYRGAQFPLDDPDRCELWMPPNDPWNESFRFNSGLQVWRNSPGAWDLLRKWWRVDVKETENC